MIFAIEYSDGNGPIDQADSLTIIYADKIASTNLQLLRSPFSNFALGRVKWPTALATLTGSSVIPIKPLVVKRKSTNERYWAIDFSVTTTATAGNRSFNGSVIYVPRRRLNW